MIILIKLRSAASASKNSSLSCPHKSWYLFSYRTDNLFKRLQVYKHLCSGMTVNAFVHDDVVYMLHRVHWMAPPPVTRIAHLQIPTNLNTNTMPAGHDMINMTKVNTHIGIV